MSTPEAVDPPSALPRGTRLGEFELRRVLGVGGFGIVYLAFDHALEREVAVKEYMPSSLVGRTATMQVSLLSQSNAETFSLGLRSFVNEARLLARFDHPSLVKVHRYWEDNNTAYMAMPYYRGSNLHAERRRMTQPPDEAWLRSILEPLLGAMERLHREGVYHRDISPDNIILEPDGRPVLLDFGAARRVISDKSMALTAILKPAYAPIEQYAETGNVKQGPWTDLYAMGATMHYLLLGRAPAPATTRTVVDDMAPLASQALPGCSVSFLQCLDWMLSPRPNDRPQSVAAVREALTNGVPPGNTHRPEAWQATQALGAKPPNADAPTVLDVSRNPQTEPPRAPAEHAATVLLTRAQAHDDAPPTIVTPRPAAPAAPAAEARKSAPPVVPPVESPQASDRPVPPPQAKTSGMRWPLLGGAALVVAAGAWLALKPAATPPATSSPALAASAPASATVAAAPAEITASANVAPAVASVTASAPVPTASVPTATAAKPAPAKVAAANPQANPPATGGAPSLATSITKIPPADTAARNPAEPGGRTAAATSGNAASARPHTAATNNSAARPNTPATTAYNTPVVPPSAAATPVVTAKPAPAPEPEPVVVQTRALSPSERCEGRVLLALWTCIDRQCRNDASLRDHPECVKVRAQQAQRASPQ
jgi:serine/threonine protein kinase